MTEHLAAVDLVGLERMAAHTLPDDAYAYFSTGARDEFTQRANRAGWDSWALIPQVLTDTRSTSLSTTILGRPVGNPIMVAPMAAQRLAHPEGELAMARASAHAGSIMVLSMSSTEPIESVAATDGLTVWLQLYVPQDARALDALVARASTAGAAALVITVDSILERSTHRRPVGNRPLAFPPLPMNPGIPMHDCLDWRLVSAIINSTALPVVLKGILSPADAVKAIDVGAAGIVVSNHGGRQLDGAITTAQALPEILTAVDGRTEVYVDGGIRRGSHVLKALALGARAVLVGRPVLWGLAAAGEAGARRALDILTDELDQDSRQAGVVSMVAVPRTLVKRSWIAPTVPSLDAPLRS